MLMFLLVGQSMFCTLSVLFFLCLTMQSMFCSLYLFHKSHWIYINFCYWHGRACPAHSLSCYFNYWKCRACSAYFFCNTEYIKCNAEHVLHTLCLAILAMKCAEHVLHTLSHISHWVYGRETVLHTLCLDIFYFWQCIVFSAHFYHKIHWVYINFCYWHGRACPAHSLSCYLSYWKCRVCSANFFRNKKPLSIYTAMQSMFCTLSVLIFLLHTWQSMFCTLFLYR